MSKSTSIFCDSSHFSKLLRKVSYYSNIKRKDEYTQLLISGWYDVIYKNQGHKIDLVFPLKIFGVKSKLALAIMRDGSCKCSSIYPLRITEKLTKEEHRKRQQRGRDTFTMNDIPEDEDAIVWSRKTLSGFICRFKKLILENNMNC